MVAPDAAFPVIWDSGASIAISHEKLDFVGPISRPSTINQFNGIAKGLRIEGEGKVSWSFHDLTGKLRTLKLPAYYVPKIRVLFLSTTSLLQTYSDETIRVEAHPMTMSVTPNDPNRPAIAAHVNPDNNLPTSQAYRRPAVRPAAECLNSTITAVNEANFNISEPEKELLRWHYRLGHMSFQKIQFLMHSGVLTKSNNTRRCTHKEQQQA
jgi:GAG-pre-integrase domain